MAEENALAASREEFLREDLIRMAVKVVSAYVAQNPVPPAQLPDLIQTVYSALIATGSTPAAIPAEAQKPAVPIKKSITPDYVVCLEDGKKLKMLKRHLRTNYGMTPEEYRAKWGLAPDYPMVAPKYAEQRSQFAKKIGLGRKPAERPTATRGRKRK